VTAGECIGRETDRIRYGWRSDTERVAHRAHLPREFNGRAPTPEETRKHLAFDRLAKSSSLDPATLLLIVDAGRRSGDDDRAGQVARIEALLRRNAKTAGEPGMPGPTRDLIVSAITVCLCVVVDVLAGAAAVPAVGLISAFVLGVAVALAFMYLPLIVSRR
jgi:hypothetical protein